MPVFPEDVRFIRHVGDESGHIALGGIHEGSIWVGSWKMPENDPRYELVSEEVYLEWSYMRDEQFRKVTEFAASHGWLDYASRETKYPEARKAFCEKFPTFQAALDACR